MEVNNVFEYLIFENKLAWLWSDIIELFWIFFCINELNFYIEKLEVLIINPLSLKLKWQ